MDQEKIGKFIADRRKKKKLTQEELASILNVNSRSISRWENGKCMPDISLYNSICEVLEISVNELLSGEKIDNEKYQEKFEENMINVLSGVELKNKNLRKVNLVVLFISVFIISFILFNYFCSHVYLKHDYDKSLFSVSLNNDALELSTPSMGESKYAYLEYQDECLVFVTYYENIESIIKNHKNFSDFTGYDLSEEKSGRQLYLSDSCMKKSMSVYYTKEDFNSINSFIKNNDFKKLDKIINKSNLLYKKK